MEPTEVGIEDNRTGFVGACVVGTCALCNAEFGMNFRYDCPRLLSMHNGDDEGKKDG
jgi:hypothetical protein